MSARGRILVAEDEDADLQLMQRALAKAHVDTPVTYARDGDEVIHYLEGVSRYLPVLLLLDLKMPRVDGFAVLEWLQHRPGPASVSVIVVSSSSDSRDISRAGALGAHYYIVKPNDPAELVRALERVQEFWRGNVTSGTGSQAMVTEMTSNQRIDTRSGSHVDSASYGVGGLAARV
jgi:CheY-like chemotaxis protein